MPQRKRWLVSVLMIAGLALAGCGQTSDEGSESEPATLEAIDGTGLYRVTLSAEAAERLDIQTAPVRDVDGEGGQAQQTVIPYSAVVYDPNGETWAYTSPEPLIFVRELITIDRIDGDQAFLSSGPPSGTPVVTVGPAELYGTELGID